MSYIAAKQAYHNRQITKCEYIHLLREYLKEHAKNYKLAILYSEKRIKSN